MWKEKIVTGLGFCDKAVWSRAARRQAVKHGSAGANDEEEDMAFGFKIYISDNAGGVGGSRATIRWLKGHDSVLFESFCGMLKRSVEELLR